MWLRIYVRANDGMRCVIGLSLIAIALVALTRLDGHKVWINPANLNTVQGAAQLSFRNGTLLNVGGQNAIVRENVNEVVRALKDAK